MNVTSTSPPPHYHHYCYHRRHRHLQSSGGNPPLLPDNTVEVMSMQSSGRPLSSPTDGAVHPATIAGIGTIGHSEMARYGTTSPIGALPEDPLLATTEHHLDERTICSLMQAPIGDFSVLLGKICQDPCMMARSPCSLRVLQAPNIYQEKLELTLAWNIKHIIILCVLQCALLVC
jgi:hypothetical protein